MKRLADFLKSTVLGGALVIVPILLVWVLIGKVFGKLTGLVAPLVHVLQTYGVGAKPLFAPDEDEASSSPPSATPSG